jgi:hypothetical protein
LVRDAQPAYPSF